MNIGARTLVACCDPALHIQAESVLHLLGELAEHGSLREGSRIRLGLSQLTVRARDNQLLLLQPRFEADVRELSDDITQTLSLLADQAALAQQLGVAIQPTSFDHRMVVACGALAHAHIYLERSEPTDDNDSGWYIGPADEPGEVECEHRRVYELVRERPALLRVLGLPSGYLVAFEGDAIKTVLDTRDQDLWAAS